MRESRGASGRNCLAPNGEPLVPAVSAANFSKTEAPGTVLAFRKRQARSTSREATVNRGNKRWICQEIDHNGKKCGKTTQLWFDGKPMCREHRMKANGEEFPNMAKAGPRKDELTSLERDFDRAKDPTVRRQLAEAIFTERRKREVGCAICRQAREDNRVKVDEDRYVMERLTPMQRAAITDLMHQVRDIQAIARQQPIYVPNEDDPKPATSIITDAAGNKHVVINDHNEAIRVLLERDRILQGRDPKTGELLNPPAPLTMAEDMTDLDLLDEALRDEYIDDEDQ
jgi:hypothetical protein